MKLILVIAALLALSSATEKGIVFEYPLLTTQYTYYPTLLTYVHNYIQPVSTTKVVFEQKYSWQYNLNYIVDAPLREYVSSWIYYRPISVWPATIRYLVFPHIYGYYDVPTLTTYLTQLRTVEKVETSSSSSDLSSDDKEKLQLLEKIAKLEELKKEVEKNLINQSQQLMESKKYEEKIAKIEEKVKRDLGENEDIAKILRRIF